MRLLHRQRSALDEHVRGVLALARPALRAPRRREGRRRRRGGWRARRGGAVHRAELVARSGALRRSS
eukprot:scaffold21566_cov63-Phaeocystis_antarctica.AAC.1